MQKNLNKSSFTKVFFLLLNSIGKILKDEETLESHNIQSGDSLHLVVKKKTTETSKPEEKQSTASAAPGGSTGAAGAAGTGMPWMGMPGMNFTGRLPGMGMMNDELMQNYMNVVRMFSKPS